MRTSAKLIDATKQRIIDRLNEKANGTFRGEKGRFAQSWNGQLAWIRDGQTGQDIILRWGTGYTRETLEIIEAVDTALWIADQI